MGALVVKVLTRMNVFREDPLLANLARLMVPFTSFFLAEEIHASGVLAVVVCGLLVSRFGTSSITLGSRIVAFPLWSMMTFILNAALFLLVGFEIPQIVGTLSHEKLIRGLILVPVIYVAMVAARFVGHHAIILVFVWWIAVRNKSSVARISARALCLWLRDSAEQFPWRWLCRFPAFSATALTRNAI